jgi:glycerol-3-phosphate cytidylyltransferase
MTIGYAYVVADIFHVGHLRHLLNCKSVCDILIVGVLTDEATMEKKPRPIIPFEERIQIVSALECVDVVVAQETYSPKDNVNSIKPDYLFESASHEDPHINAHGETLVMPYYPAQSTTMIKERVRNE